MKKEYNAPEIEVTKFDVEDVITASSVSLVNEGNEAASYSDLF